MSKSISTTPSLLALPAVTKVLVLALLAFFTALCMGAQPATAFPLQIDYNKVTWLSNSTRARLIAFTNVDDTWKRIPIQIDEVEDGAAIVFRNPQAIMSLRKDLAHPGKIDPFEGKFDEVHRISLDDQQFGICNEKCAAKAAAEGAKLCPGGAGSQSHLTRIDLSYTKKTAFIMECAKNAPQTFKSSAKYDNKTSTMSSERFSYTHKGKRDVLFEDISLMPEKTSALSKSEMQVYLKPKSFFNIHFAENDIVSRVTSVTNGPLSTGLEVAFSLNVLTFKVSSQICCDVSFYKDALYFPVMLDLPFEGSSFKDGSGMFFGFNYLGDVQKDIQFMAPKLNEVQNSDTPQSSALLLRTKGKLLAVGFRSMQKLDGTKVIPTIAFPEDLKKNGFPDVRSNFGLFYDVTALKKGFHHFNIWFYFGEEKQADLLTEYAKNGIQFTATQVVLHRL